MGVSDREIASYYLHDVLLEIALNIVMLQHISIFFN